MWQKYNGEIPKYDEETHSLLIFCGGEVAKAFVRDGYISSWDDTVQVAHDETTHFAIIENPGE